MGRSPCCVKEGLKKGPWTQEEDEKLIAFVKEHGHGNWRALPKKCGLLRCGKSCRLRWNNYLRPDIKRGLFTQSEEQKIFQLHALVGNKWAFIASQLPKRTDNEIKNYWNTVLKKRLQKENLNSFMSFGMPKMNRTLTLAAEKHTKSTQLQQDNQHGKSAGSASSNATSVMSCTHLAQWESARLEAEARLAKESQSSKKTHTPFSFTYMGHSFSSSNTASTTSTSSALSSLSNHTHTNPQSLLQLSTCLLPNAPPSNISTSCLIHHPSTIKPLFNSTLSLPSIVSMPPIRRSASDTSSTSSKSWSSLPSQESIASALILGRCGRLSWQAKELSFITSPARSSHTSQSSLISQLLCQIDGDDCGGIELQESGKDGKLEANTRGQEELNLEATSSIVDLNSTMESSMDLTSHMENWHDFIFDVENSCSDVVSTSPIAMASPQGEQFTHDANSLISNTPKAGTPQGHMGLDLEGLNLFHFDSLMSCENYGNQHSNVLMKELLWDTPASVSISSTSIVN